MNPLLLVDYYKTEHHRMLPEDTTKIYSNFTPRKSRLPGIDHVVVFGIQHFILEYLIKRLDQEFFSKDWAGPKGLQQEYERHVGVNTDHIKALWNLQYLPIKIKALPEGTLCPIGVPVLTITNTHPDFAWLTNYLETLLSCCLWQPITSATIAYEYKKLLTKYAIETTDSDEFVQWQGHDFSMRGMSSVESAILSGMAHLTSFTGTDTIPAIYALEESYGASGLIGASVPATEHSVMCMGTMASEIDTFSRLLDLYPTGILSVVSDTWDLWKVCTEFLPTLKDKILARDGKLVIRPDSGDPVDIICGMNKYSYEKYLTDKLTLPSLPQRKGVIELLWDTFGGKINEHGYKELDSHIGAIYGDSITLERATAICERLKSKGFASTNIVFGIGSYTYQYNTRDTFGFAMKATYGEISHPAEGPGGTGFIEPREIFKAPITDSGEKKSKKGLLKVCYDGSMETYVALGKPADGTMKPIICKDQQTSAEENSGLLETVFLDGKLVKTQTLSEIRERLKV
jgi:nicotinamide phosphoribosyltransferase